MCDWEVRFRDLVPFVKDGVIRVGERLRRSNLVYDQVHPILLSANSHFSKLVMKSMHEKKGRAGSERTLRECRRK